MNTEELTPEKRLNVLNKFLGYGNPEGSLWFIGMEGAGKWPDDSQKDKEEYEKHNHDYFPFEKEEIANDKKEFRKAGKRYTNVYDIMSKIAVSLDPKNGIDHFNSWEKYCEEDLLLRRGGAFQSNLYSLGKPSNRDDCWPCHYPKLFGYKCSRDYYESVRETRIELLRKFRNERNFSYCICFGKRFWDEFKRMHSLVGEGVAVGNCRVYMQEDLIIALTPFFTYGKHMPHKQILELTKFMRDKKSQLMSPG